jgi:uncharacterized protein
VTSLLGTNGAGVLPPSGLCGVAAPHDEGAHLTHDEPAIAAEQALVEWFRERGSALIGYSGGVDSTYLAAMALEALGPDRMLAVLGMSSSVAGFQARDARDRAVALGLPLRTVETHELDDPSYAANPSNRCYHCKSELWHRLVPVARELGFAVVCDGTNADDVRDYRPGMRAAAEKQVCTPLADVGLTKAQIRWLSRRRNLPTWNAPAAPCLASRLPYGVTVTRERLRRVDRAEAALRALGIAGDLRVRHHAGMARVELPAESLDEWLRPDRAALLEEVVREAGFDRVVLDLAGFRSGSLNVLHGIRTA